MSEGESTVTVDSNTEPHHFTELVMDSPKRYEKEYAKHGMKVVSCRTKNYSLFLALFSENRPIHHVGGPGCDSDL